ncbi:MAG: CBS domain-containing protein [Alphaproteobacteria bacterium]|nr:CBS domain-containing protein [Alphaproteobacteria bacterium]
MRASDVMTSPVVVVGPDARIEDIAAILLRHSISAVPVVDSSDRLIGIVSEGDLYRRPEAGTGPRRSWLQAFAEQEEQARLFIKTHGHTAREVMTTPVVSVAESADLGEVAELLERHRIKRVPVVRDGKVVGVVSRANILQGLVAKRYVPGAGKPTEGATRERLLEALRATDLAAAAHINAVIHDSVAHLWGLVQSQVEADALRVAAEGVPGIRRVESHIGLMPRSSFL